MGIILFFPGNYRILKPPKIRVAQIIFFYFPISLFKRTIPKDSWHISRKVMVFKSYVTMKIRVPISLIVCEFIVTMRNMSLWHIFRMVLIYTSDVTIKIRVPIEFIVNMGNMSLWHIFMMVFYTYPMLLLKFGFQNCWLLVGNLSLL